MRIYDKEGFKEFIIIKVKNKTDGIESFMFDSFNNRIYIKFLIMIKSILMQQILSK